MNPYLEQPGMWPDVHNRLIVAICDQIQAHIAPNYRAVITPYVVFESIEIAPVRAAIPDVGVLERDVSQTGATTDVVSEAAPLTFPAVMEVL
jgi:hypothetical protein